MGRLFLFGGFRGRLLHGWFGIGRRFLRCWFGLGGRFLDWRYGGRLFGDCGDVPGNWSGLDFDDGQAQGESKAGAIDRMGEAIGSNIDGSADRLYMR
jgi:hypothetical protein